MLDFLIFTQFYIKHKDKNNLKFPGNIFYYLRLKKNSRLPYRLKQLFFFNQKTESLDMVSKYRLELLKSKKQIEVSDFGAGSKSMKSNNRDVSDIVKNSSSSEQFGVFYQKLVKEFKITSVLELGTSLGIGTMYFALSENSPSVVTIEACSNTFGFSKQNFEKRKISNVEFVNDTFDNVFQNRLLEGKLFDLVFIDGNHKSKSVLKYYEYISNHLASEKCIYIVDDINWTLDMYKAWKIIAKKNKKNLVINMGRMGVVFDSYNSLLAGNFPINFVKAKKM